MNLEMLKRVQNADVYKNGTLAGGLSRTAGGAVRFAYTENYFQTGGSPVAFSLPLAIEPVEKANGALPAFFAGCWRGCPR